VLESRKEQGNKAKLESMGATILWTPPRGVEEGSKKTFNAANRLPGEPR